MEEYVRPKIELFLKERGLKLNKEKTKIVYVKDGFNFLGFRIRLQSGTLLTSPQPEKMQSHLHQLRDYLRTNKQAPIERVVRDLAPGIRGWSNYYRHGTSKQAFQKADHLFFWMLWRWSKRRHPKKSVAWVKQHYFRKDWTFGNRVRSLPRHDATTIVRHIKVQAKASPLDPALRSYWQDRWKRRTLEAAYAKARQAMLVKRDGRCGIRKQIFDPDADLQMIDDHHKIPRSDGGENKLENRMLVHRWCHHAHHQKTGYKKSRRLEPYEVRASRTVLRGLVGSNAHRLPNNGISRNFAIHSFC